MAVSGLTETRELSRRLEPLLAIGRTTRGTTRLAWTAEQRQAEHWFREQAGPLEMRVETDPAGNLWACPPVPPPWTVIGSHLDTVRDGGPFDGALGVACAFEVASACQAVAVVSFADEEGARFNTPTFGSRALIGALDPEDILTRRDCNGQCLGEALTEYGLDGQGLARAQAWLPRIARLIEIHVDQTTELRDVGEPIGLIDAAVARVRLEITVRGAADHAGATPMHARKDALGAAAHLILEGERLATQGMVATATRIEVEPNALTTVPSQATIWLDARSPDEDAVRRWLSGLTSSIAGTAAKRGVDGVLEVRSRAPRTELDRDLLDQLTRLAEGRGLGPPRMLSYAGHDACILARDVPTSMVMVRNPAGVSHAPEETVELEDAVVAVALVSELCM